MKNAKKILLILLSLALVFTLFACGKCKEHVDENKDGKCDKCEEEMKLEIADVALVEGGVANFQFVVETGVSSDVIKAVDNIVKALKEYDLTVQKVNDKGDNIKDVEVLVGDITTRGDAYKIDKYALGSKGYVIKIVDSKVVINAGSHAQLADAVEEFGNEILGLEDEPDELLEVIMTPAQMVEEIQDDYRISSLKVNGADMKGYTIAADSTNSYHKAAATSLQKLLYERTGYWFEIVAPDKADKSIVFKAVEKSSDLPNGFKISVNDKSQIVIECAYDNMLEEGVAKFTNSKITSATGDVEFKTGVVLDNFNASVISYDDYGAVGDGETNDYEAIYKAHVMANKGGQTVVATAGKTYYLESPVINGKPTPIPVMTNVDWHGAKFIVDDRKMYTTDGTKNWNVAVFSVEENASKISYTASNAAHKEYLNGILAGGLNKNTTKIDLGDNYRCPVMIITANATHKVYRRRKYSAYAGAAMQEVIILDKDGNVRSDTPVMYDYIDLTGLTIIKLDEIEPITLKNGEFTTRASQANCIVVAEDGYRGVNAPYISRGFNVSRSYTTIENVKHYVTDEVPFSQCINEDRTIKYVGPTYRGFYVVSSCTDVTIKDCTITGRRAYRRPGDNGTGGTYDLSLGLTNNVVFDGCVQTNFWVTVDENFNIKPAKEGDAGAINGMNPFPGIEVICDNGWEGGSEMHWGSGGTNLCKNTKYINSTISRYDAHEGTYGGEVKGSTVCTVALTGAGDFYIEDSRIIPDGETHVFGLRKDYGYTWDGTVYIKNVSTIVKAKTDGVYSTELCVTSPNYGSANWYWGYMPAMPNIVIEDLYFRDVNDYNADTGTYAQVPADVPILLYGKNITANFREHLAKTQIEPYYSVEDKDKDGYIDIPDIDGDNEWGNTTVKYDTIKASLGRDYDQGFKMSSHDPNYARPADGLYDNFSQVKPPEFAKILSNKGGYTYKVRNTATSGISNGLYHGVEENYKGYYGSTKFYYGPGENDYFVGPLTAGDTAPSNNPFVFY